MADYPSSGPNPEPEGLTPGGPDVSPPDSTATRPEVLATEQETPTSLGGRISFLVQFFGSLAIAGLVLLYLLFMPEHHPDDGEVAESDRMLARAVEIVDEEWIRIDRESSLAAKLDTDRVRLREISTPVLRVTGTVAASLRPIGPDSTDQWQFNDPEALEAFFEWRRAEIDVQFSEEQAVRVRDLNETRLTSRRTIIERLERLVTAGTDTRADLQLAEAELMETEILGREEIHEADSALRVARQEMAVAARQLQLMGLDIEMLESASSDVDIVVAEVPEEFQTRVRIGQLCEARFVGMRRRVFPGTVQRISPTLSLERRAVRVLFFVDDPDDELRPGMFADIGLGTDPRETMLIPATSVIHIGRDDFVFTRSDPGSDLWTLQSVEVGDTRDGEVEIFSGLEPDQEIISEGAILLKPVAMAVLRGQAGGIP
jgi:membrane fusion protein, heavy metal efflux system